jgi:hypothetical protein
MEDNCSFCGSYVDPIGGDTKKTIIYKGEARFWDGQCKIADSLEEALEIYMENTGAYERQYWHTWLDRGISPQARAFRMHLAAVGAFDMKMVLKPFLDLY